MLIRTQVERFTNKVYRTKGGLYIPRFSAFVPKHHNVLCLVAGPQGRILIPAVNIVGNEGDKYYAQRGAAETPTLAFANLYLSTVNWDATHPSKTSTSDNIASMISGGEKAKAAGYPKTNDTDPDNTGGGLDIVTWKFSYAKADFTDTDIDAGAIAIAGVTSWGAGAGTDQILTGFDLTAFAKSADDTLVVFVNHTMNGV